MNQPPKPREYWIEKNQIGADLHLASSKPMPLPKGIAGDIARENILHVIEYSAYESLKQKLELAVGALDNCEKVIVEILAKIKE